MMSWLQYFWVVKGRLAYDVWNSIIREISALFHDPATQQMIVLCLACYFVAFLIAECRPSSNSEQRQFSEVNFCLAVFVAWVLLRYWLEYDKIFSRMQVPALMSSIVFAKSVSAWVFWRNRNAEQRMTWLVVLLVCLLSCAGLWQPQTTTAVQYHGDYRRTGPWDNPNIFGLLMATGTILAISLIFRNLILEGLDHGFEKQYQDFQIKRYGLVILGAVALIVIGNGLLKSYSRGAWVGLICGLSYLVITVKRKKPHASVKLLFWTHCFAITCIFFFIGMLFFLLCWKTEWLTMNRASSIFDQNDFSWRNRIEAWKGALQIMAENTWFGAGWSRPEPLYENYYMPHKLVDGAAIEMNDYLTLGATLGVPALFCFGVYLWLLLTQSPGSRKWGAEINLEWFQMTCRAGAIVLAVGFWFDGGLFELSTATVFWILLESGRQDPRKEAQNIVRGEGKIHNISPC